MKRATVDILTAGDVPEISIHALVKRATYTATRTAERGGNFNPRPREEGDGAARRGSYHGRYFNPRPREEGDIVINGSWRYPSNFNPRPREEGDI